MTATHPVPTVLYVCGRCLTREDQPFVMGTTAMSGICSRCGGQAAFVVNARINEPRIGHHGVTTIGSTDCALATWPPHIWDVNGYYRELGVPTNATRGEIKKRFIALGSNPSERLTYIVKQLLDADVRAAYDAIPLGEVFVDDYVIRAALRRAKEEAANAIRDGYADLEGDLEAITAGDLADALGSSISALDTSRRRAHDERPSHPWGFYLWQSYKNETDYLDKWRSALVSAFWEKGVIANIAVGYAKSMEPWVVAQVGPATVFFLNEETVPTEAMAEAAVQEHINPGA